MRITLLTLGTRGDVQPFVALGAGLRQAGYNVTIVTAEQFAGFVGSHGLDFAPIDRSFLDMLDTPAGKSAFEGGSRLQLIRQSMTVMRRVIQDSWAGAQGADAIIYHQKILAGYHIAEKLEIPAMIAMPIPVYPTRAFTNPILPMDLPAAINRASYAANAGGKAPFMGMINQFRQETLDLRPRGRFESEERLPGGRLIPVLHAYSPAVVPMPPDWPENVTATGYWFLDGEPGWLPPADLLDFLDAGPPPVYIGFGSMVTKDPVGKMALITDALHRAGQRGVVAAGAVGRDTIRQSESIYILDQAPHDWLFPRMAAVVHHGGAGTTAAGLRAGVPSVLAPFFGDQYFWARRVQALGAGPAAVPQKKLTVGSLAAAIHSAVTDESMGRNAQEISHIIRTEDGVGRAVALIRRWLETGSFALTKADHREVTGR